MRGIFVTSLVGLAISMGARAEGARYLVKMKSQAAFNSVVAQMRGLSPAFFQNPHVSQFRVFDQVTNSTEALENIGLLVVDTNDDAQNLKNNPDVEYVEKEVWHPLPEPMRPIHTAGDSSSTAPANPIPTPWGIDAVKAPAAWAITRGEGAKVLVLDTGVDRGHPALKDRFVAGQNFVGDAQAVDDVTDHVGHGTHVSGTILANGENGGLVGVAPRAQLYMGRVCATEGCSSVAIVEGVNWGIDQQVQVMSLSLSGPYSTPAEQDAFNRAEQANIVVVAASGNDSAATVGYPAALPTVLAIGAVDNTLKRASFSNYGPELGLVAPGVDVFSSVPRGTGRASDVSINNGHGSIKVQSTRFDGSPVGSVVNSAVVYAGFGKPEDFQANPVQGKVALIQRGANLSFHDKAMNAIAAGATAVVIYNNVNGLDNVAVTTDGTEIAVPAVMITQKDGEALRAALASGAGATISLGVVATDYATYQGTSMATPHVAGVAALVRSANPSLTAAQVRALLKDTATVLGPNDQNQYGAGLVNAEAAVEKAVQTAGQPLQLANGF